MLLDDDLGEVDGALKKLMAFDDDGTATRCFEV